MSEKSKPVQNLATVYEFATLKKVTNVAVYYAIKMGYIIPTMLGKHKNIDLDVYQDYDFAFSKILKKARDEQEPINLEQN